VRSRGTIRMPVAHGQARGDTRYAELRKTGAPWGSPYAADQACLIAGNPPRSAAARACMRSSPAGRRHRHVRVFGNHRPGNVRAGLCQRQATLPMPTLTRLQHNLHAEVLVSARHGRWEAVNCCACRAHAASRTHQLLLPSTLLACLQASCLKQPFQTLQAGARARHSRQQASGDATPSSIATISPFMTAGVVVRMQPYQVAFALLFEAVSLPALGAVPGGVGSSTPMTVPSLYSKKLPVCSTDSRTGAPSWRACQHNHYLQSYMATLFAHAGMTPQPSHDSHASPVRAPPPRRCTLQGRGEGMAQTA